MPKSTTRKPSIERAREIFRERWGYPDFRSHQSAVIEAVLQGEDVLAVLPTSAGKSACFQVPALMTDRITLVFSPLIALMKDQVDACNARGLAAVTLNSHVEFEDQTEIINSVQRGEVRLLYIAPERLASRSFRDLLGTLDVAYLVVDEAHCVSKMGHDFRPAYMRIREVLSIIQKGGHERPQIIAVTATATADIETDIAFGVGMDNGYTRVIADAIRPNITYDVYQDGSWLKLASIVDSLDLTRGRHIIYSCTRKGAERVCEIVNDRRRLQVADYYHADRRPEERTSVQNRFKSGSLPLVVATNAFGMGVDIPDIRTVIHHGIPGCIEDYVQETGRAGRDGKPSRAILLNDDYAVSLRWRFLNNSNPPPEAFQQVWGWLKTNIPYKGTLDLSVENIAEAMSSDGFGSNMAIDGTMVGSVLAQLEAVKAIDRFVKKASTPVNVLDRNSIMTAASGGSSRRGSVGVVAAELSRLLNVRAGSSKVYIDKLDLIKRSGLASSTITTALRKLEEDGFVEVEAPYVGKSTSIPDRDVTLQDVLPLERLRAKRAREIWRLESMINYTTATDRTEYIRSYFMNS